MNGERHDGNIPAETHAAKNERRFRPVRRLALAGVYAALLIGGKEALAALPNVEVVTLLCALGGFALGWTALSSVLAFVTVEGAIYGFGTWIVSYYIHWPLVTLAFMLLSAIVKPHSKAAIRIIPTAAALLSVVCFSVLTSLVDVGLLTGLTADFAERFAVYFLRGIPFYVTQLVVNLIIFPTVFPILARLLIRLRGSLFA